MGASYEVQFPSAQFMYVSKVFLYSELKLELNI